MQTVSDDYKKTMLEAYSPHSYMYVTIGLINHQAQNNAFVPNQDTYAYYSNLASPLNNYEVSNLYAVCDQNFTKSDGSFYFMPRSKNGIIFNQGIVSKSIRGLIEIRFDAAYEIKGLTIDFGNCYPANFKIESDNKTVSITNNNKKLFVTEEIFSQAQFIKIVPERMINGEGRLRVHKISMGIGLYFDSNNIISSSKKEHISPVMETLPNLDFYLVINNRGRLFDVENDSSSINFLKPRQKISVQYGQEIFDGKVEWQQGAVVFLREWSADDIQMNFRATDRFDGMDKTYYRGLYRAEGISLYDLAKDVLKDAEVDERDYWLDEYLKKVKVTNSIPPVSHSKALQLIANAGRCLLNQDRDGRICIKSSFLPVMNAQSDNATYFSKIDNILDTSDKISYAMVTADYTDIKSTQYFLPYNKPDSTYLNTGYVSEAVANNTGVFADNPRITINLEARYKCFGVTLKFGNNSPINMIIRSYLSNSLQEEYEINGLKKITYVDHEFPEFDKLEFEFTKGKPNNRVILNTVVFGAITDYTLKYKVELLKTPKGSQLEQVKELQVIQTSYSQTDELKEIAKAKVQAPIKHTFYFSEPVYELSCVLRNPHVNAVAKIIDSSNYFVTVEIDKIGEFEVVCYGKNYNISESRFIKQLNITGKTEEWSNPLISSDTHAEDIANWVGGYLQSDRMYEISYRGEPRIDANDIVYLENKYVDNLAIKIYEHSLNYNGALSGSIKARRAINVEGT